MRMTTMHAGCYPRLQTPRPSQRRACGGRGEISGAIRFANRTITTVELTFDYWVNFIENVKGIFD